MIPDRPRWWQWPIVLSLDAPAVVVVWQVMIYRLSAESVRWAPGFVLGASVWLAYSADRWLEGWRLHPSRVRTQRHAFHQRRRWTIAVVWMGVLAADVAVALNGLTRREFFAGTLVLLPVAAYLLSHQGVHRQRRGRMPKEICVALLLAAGIGVFPAADREGGWEYCLGPLGLFAVLAFANCALISGWENAVDCSQGQISLASEYGAGGLLGRWAAGLAVALGLAGFLAVSGLAAAGGLAATASGALLLGIDGLEPRLGWEAARGLADAALLTPAAVLAGHALRLW
jgi:hypothetical protein